MHQVDLPTGTPVVTSRREADISLTMAANAVVMDRRRPPTPTKSISKWLVQGIVVATTLFALLDLYLLMTSSPH